jgi:mRNA interferase RelE/StbE
VPYSVTFLRTAVRELAELEKRAQLQIAAKIDDLASDPVRHGVQQLRGEAKLYRLRVGDYRIIFEVDHAARTVTVATIGHRRDVYRRR